MTTKYLLPSSFKNIFGGLAVGSSRNKVFFLSKKDSVAVSNTCTKKERPKRPPKQPLANISIYSRLEKTSIPYTEQKMKFSIKDFFSKCDQIRRKL